MAEKRIILAPSRSGSTALAHCLNGHSDMTLIRSPIKNNYIQKGKSIDYSGYKSLSKVPTKIGFTKISFGMNTLEDCTYLPFPIKNKKLIKELKPVFLFRDPIQNENSWIKTGRSNSQLFHKAYNHNLKLLEEVRGVTDKVMSITYEKFSSNPKDMLKKICNFWEVPFEKEMLEWKHEFPEHIKGGALHKKILKSSGVKKCFNKIILSEKQISETGKRFRKAYEEIAKLQN